MKTAAPRFRRQSGPQSGRSPLAAAASPAALAAALSVAACAAGPAADETVMPMYLAQNFAVFEESICPAASGETPFPPAASVADDPSIAPFQAFDNLYFVGSLVDSAWALTTPEGIVIFDAMFPYEVEPFIVDGLTALGLDPADIAYVVVAHGHADHFGGAAFLQDTYGAQVVMSETDWALVEGQAGGDTPIPDRDVVVADGDSITLGGATIRFYETPGHTAGTISSLFTVYDDGEPHTAALWGGTAMNFLSPELIAAHKTSAERFAALDPSVDVVLSNHQYADGTLFKMEALAARGPGDPNPYVVGNAVFQDWMAVTDRCADAWLAVRAAEAEEA